MALAASMRLVPSGTSTGWPLMVSLGMRVAPDEVFELRTVLLDVADVGTDGAVVERADGRARAALRHVEDGIEVFLATLPLHDAPGHLVDPARRLGARRALTTALVGVEARDHHEGLGDGHGLVHHDDPGGADHGALRLGPVGVHGDVDLVGREDGGGGAAGHHALQLATTANAAAVVVDQLAERHRDGRLDDTGLLHVSGHGVDPRAALALRAEPGKPLRATVHDVRDGHDGFDV